MNSNNTATKWITGSVRVVLWLLFAVNLIYLLASYPRVTPWHYGSLLHLNGFTILIWTMVSFFSALISSYSKNYLKGFKYEARFSVLCLSFTLSVMVFVLANHLGLMLIAWLLSGVFMSQLIGIDRRWGEARQASKLALKYFATGTAFLGAGILLLATYAETTTLTGIIGQVDQLPSPVVLIAALCIITAAIIQSSMYPFHRWLLSAMTAPTPSSALMHAGFVNGSGILLTLFAVVLFTSDTLIILFVIGGLTAVIAQFAKLLQVNVKQKLACSTIAQMGFMIMQCGLGFFNAAVVHLVLHGFYKAYLFLSAGEEVGKSNPKANPYIRIKPLQAIVVLIFGLLGAWLFTFLTGKHIGLNSGLFLTLIVAITVGQATYNIVKEKSLSYTQKLVLPTVLFIVGISAYALMYNGMTLLMADVPMAVIHAPLTGVEIGFGIVFFIGFFIMKLGIYRKYPWLFVKLMNLTQPDPKTVVMYKSKTS
ncbi:proton-conducting transporter transmembrane domain-containing protein [Gaetbulibacter aestuarii]|uniref:Proton-conducting transporter membrane subunit n=1 Tax=Gaetbulibacter aestuarii TaxID=1502358 RepID=A0ABW7MVC5_9FLAO